MIDSSLLRLRSRDSRRLLKEWESADRSTKGSPRTLTGAKATTDSPASVGKVDRLELVASSRDLCEPAHDEQRRQVGDRVVIESDLAQVAQALKLCGGREENRVSVIQTARSRLSLERARTVDDVELVVADVEILKVGQMGDGGEPAEPVEGDVEGLDGRRQTTQVIEVVLVPVSQRRAQTWCVSQ